MPRQERSFRTQAIILKRRDIGEADRVVTILTPSHGKIDVVAKGARKPTSHKTGHVELFTRADMLVHLGRGLDIISQVEMVAPYIPLREDLTRGAYASYSAELLDRFVAEGEEYHNDLFQLLDDTLDRLSNDSDPRLAVRYYEVQLLDLVGFRPELTDCVVSHEPVQPEDQFFSYALGGVVTPGFSHESSMTVPINVTTLKLLRHMQRSPYSHVKSLKIGGELHDDVERVLLGYITFLLERKLQSVDFIKRLRRF